MKHNTSDSPWDAEGCRQTGIQVVQSRAPSGFKPIASEFKYRPVKLLAVASQADVFQHRPDIRLDEVVPPVAPIDFHFEPPVKIDQPFAAGEPETVVSRARSDPQRIPWSDVRRQRHRPGSADVVFRPVDSLQVL